MKAEKIGDGENLLIFVPWLSLPLPMASRWSPIPDCFLPSYFFVLIRPLPSHLFFSPLFSFTLNFSGFP